MTWVPQSNAHEKEPLDYIFHRAVAQKRLLSFSPDNVTIENPVCFAARLDARTENAFTGFTTAHDKYAFYFDFLSFFFVLPNARFIIMMVVVTMDDMAKGKRLLHRSFKIFGKVWRSLNMADYKCEQVPLLDKLDITEMKVIHFGWTNERTAKDHITWYLFYFFFFFGNVLRWTANGLLVILEWERL